MLNHKTWLLTRPVKMKTVPLENQHQKSYPLGLSYPDPVLVCFMSQSVSLSHTQQYRNLQARFLNAIMENVHACGVRGSVCVTLSLVDS